MERRNRSLVALKELNYLNSLEPDTRAKLLNDWIEEHLVQNDISDLDLELSDLKKLDELFFKNIAFMKVHRLNMKNEIDNYKKIREFLS